MLRRRELAGVPCRPSGWLAASTGVSRKRLGRGCCERAAAVAAAVASTIASAVAASAIATATFATAFAPATVATATVTTTNTAGGCR